MDALHDAARGLLFAAALITGIGLERAFAAMSQAIRDAAGKLPF